MAPESDQITQGRLGEALELLEYIGWVEFKKPLSTHTIITLHFGKGDRITSEIFDFLSKNFVQFKITRERKATRRRSKMPPARTRRIKPTGKEERLDAFFRN